MAIAAMIKITGINAISAYPRISPAVANPWPFNRPALFLISESARWPKMIAATAENGMNTKIPITRLAIALPLVVSAPVGVYPAPGAPATAAAETSRFPHLPQNCDPSAIISPQ